MTWGARSTASARAGRLTNQIDSFRSVHYPSALGNQARHGVEPTRPAPRDPMSLAEAREFIRRLLAQWLPARLRQT